jgi:hypothetical protein
VDKGLVARPLPKFAGDAARAQAEPAGSLFEPPSGREREPSS